MAGTPPQDLEQSLIRGVDDQLDGVDGLSNPQRGRLQHALAVVQPLAPLVRVRAERLVRAACAIIMSVCEKRLGRSHLRKSTNKFAG